MTALPAELGLERGEALVQRYGEAFPSAYRDDLDEVVSAGDIERIEQALASGKLTLELYHTEASLPHEWRFEVFSPNTDVAPSVTFEMSPSVRQARTTAYQHVDGNAVGRFAVEGSSYHRL